MSIDHGKLLALADEIESMSTYSVQIEWAARLRALAQPAEAVELPTPYHYADGGKGEPLFTANQVRAAVAVATDAAQGAVATVCLVGERYAHGHMVSVELQLSGEDAPAPKIGDRYYTHPQAAPAQGGGWKLVPIEPTQRMKSDGLYTLDEASKQAAGVSVGNLCGFAHMGAAYKAMLAAAPSQEGEWIPDRIELEQVSRMCRPNSLAYADGWNACRDAMLAAAPSPEPHND